MLVSSVRTFDYANGLATTLQRDRLQYYMFEDHSAATFRVRKALVPERLLFATSPDVSKAGNAEICCLTYVLTASMPVRFLCQVSCIP